MSGLQSLLRQQKVLMFQYIIHIYTFPLFPLVNSALQRPALSRLQTGAADGTRGVLSL